MATSSVTLSVGADDGAFSASALNTTRTSENFANGNQFYRFAGLSVPSYRRCVVTSATLTINGNSGLVDLGSETAAFTAQPGASAAITSGADATARPRTSASASFGFGNLSAATVTVTAVITEAVNVPSWTKGSALTIFGRRTAKSGLTGDYTWPTADSGNANRPHLVVVWQPAGDLNSFHTITSVRTGRKAARGAASGTLSVSGARQGSKGGRGARTGTASLTGARSGRKTGRTGLTNQRSATSSVTGRTGRRSAVAGTFTTTSTLTGRAARRAAVTGVTTRTGTRAAHTARAGARPSGVLRLVAYLTGRSVRFGAVDGLATRTGAVRVLSGRESTLRGTIALLSTLRGLTRRSGQPTQGHAGLTGRTTGTAGRQGSAVTAFHLPVNTSSGRPGHSATLTGALGGRHPATSGAAGLQGAVSGSMLVKLRTADGFTLRFGRKTGTLRILGWLGTAEGRRGMLDGQLGLTGATRGLSSRAGSRTGTLRLTSSTRGLAGHAGGSNGALPTFGTRAGQAAHSSAVRGAYAEPRAAGTGLAGRSGEVHGWASLPGQGAETLTGQAGRIGVCGHAMGTSPGLVSARTNRTGALAGRAACVGTRNGRAGRASVSAGGLTLTGAAQHQTARTGTLRSTADFRPSLHGQSGRRAAVTGVNVEPRTAQRFPVGRRTPHGPPPCRRRGARVTHRRRPGLRVPPVLWGPGRRCVSPRQEHWGPTAPRYETER